VTDDLWEEASEDASRMRRQAAMARADAELNDSVLPFLLASLSAAEYGHREAVAMGSLSSIAYRCDVDVAELAATARRRWELYRQALAEGADPVAQLEPALNGSGYGSGPEKPDEHDEGPDFSHGYSEVPPGPPGGPGPQVTRPRPPMSGPVQEATGMRRRADSTPESAMTQPYMTASPPDTGTGAGSVDTSTPSSPGGMTPSLPAGVTSNGDDTVPLTPSGIGQVTSAGDPVRRKVMAVTAVISSANPGLAAGECARVARLVVGRYLREADLTDSVVNDGPMSSGQQSGGSSSGGDGGGMMSRVLEGQGLRSMIPGMGGGGAAGAAGGAGAIEEAAPLLALAQRGRRPLGAG
jgi:hypothetical protein